jgi:cytochrome c biogenesis protein CcmG/thiol:disulfide interchange protein DsbE
MIKRLIVILIIIIGTLGYVAYQNSILNNHLSSKSESESLLTKLPDTQFKTLQNEDLRLHDLYVESNLKLLVVHFWGTWCGPCEAELPDLLDFIKKFENRSDIKFLLVAVNDDLVKVRKHIAQLSPTKATWLLDNENLHRDLFGTTRVPETFVFSSDKVSVRKYVGPQEWKNSSYFQSFDEFLLLSHRKM